MKTEKELFDALSKRAEYLRMRDELDAIIDALTDDVKAEMKLRDAEELTAGPFRVTWRPVPRVTLDSKALKASAPDVWKLYARESITRPFTVRV